MIGMFRAKVLIPIASFEFQAHFSTQVPKKKPNVVGKDWFMPNVLVERLGHF
jgi:hypothetical protein